MLSSRGLEEVENEGCLSCYPHLLLVALGLGAKQLLLEAPHLPWSRWHGVENLKLSGFWTNFAFYLSIASPLHEDATGGVGTIGAHGPFWLKNTERMSS